MSHLIIVVFKILNKTSEIHPLWYPTSVSYGHAGGLKRSQTLRLTFVQPYWQLQWLYDAHSAVQCVKCLCLSLSLPSLPLTSSLVL